MKKTILNGVIVGVIMLIIGYIIGSYIPMNLGGDKSVSFGSKEPKLTSPIDTFSYYYGFNVGQFITKDLDQLKMKEGFPSAIFLNGVYKSIEGKGNIDELQMQQFMQGFVSNKQIEIQAEDLKQGEKNIEEGRSFLEKNKTEAGVITTASGLQYKVLANGSGGVSPKNTDTVVVHYKGTLIDGTVFDSSIDRGEPVTFPVNGVIPGWTEALQLMKTGDKWKLFIPSELAYGATARSEQIKANSTLIFEVELLDVKKAR
jgi:FKBP-type peptidyl-prolyl cis-trans isomerase FklB